MRVFLSAGEASGDAYGAAFVAELRRFIPQGLEWEGIGSRRMRDAGVPLVSDSGTWGAISIAQSLQIVPRVFGGYYRAKRRLAQGTPGLFVPIDFGYANIRLSRHAKRLGWKVLYFVPPGSWRRDRQGGDLPALTDAISTPFPWSAEILAKMGANAHWFGHPIKQLLRQAAASPPNPTPFVAILPGSRIHEISENLPLIASVLRDSELASIPAHFALATSVDVDEFRARWRSLAPERTEDAFVQGDTYRVLRQGRAAIVCSGTATLEAALARCPSVVVYRVSRATEIEAKILRFKRPRFIALPNILLDRPVVPEYVQDEATPEVVRQALSEIWTEGGARQAQLDAFEELDTLLGPDDAITKTAELARSLIS